MPRPRSIIYGAGGHARELAFQLEAAGTQVLAFVDDFNHGCFLEETPVVSYEKALTLASDATWFVAIGSIEGRVKLVERLSASNVMFGTFVSPHALVAPTAKIGNGAQVFANVVVSWRTLSWAIMSSSTSAPSCITMCRLDRFALSPQIRQSRATLKLAHGFGSALGACFETVDKETR